MQTTLHFGCDFDGPIHTPAAPHRTGQLYVGPRRLLLWLESQLGLSGCPENTNYLRIELYRQALGQYLSEATEPPFFDRSFEADRFATAEALLLWRDELLLAGWDFDSPPIREGEALRSLLQPEPGATPPPSRMGGTPRLNVFASIEKTFQEKTTAPDIYPQATGIADRWAAVLEVLENLQLPLEKMLFYEPFHLQTPVIQRLLKTLRSKNVAVKEVPICCAAEAGTVLGDLQRRLCPPHEEASQAPLSAERMAGSQAGPHSPAVLEKERPDSFIQQETGATLPPSPPGSAREGGLLLILHACRDSDAATYLAQLLRKNTALRPFFLVPEMSLLLEQALMQEGFPALGILSASLARPSLQVLKLAPAFLWEPVDVFKLMEFVTLPVKPLDAGLALEIARVLAEKPGLNSDRWFAAVFGYLEQAEVPDEAREQYDFWFNRRRYRADGAAPKRDAVALYRYLQEWAHREFEEAGSGNTTLLVLAEQARRIRELLETLPEQRITFLELERIVRTIYQPSPVQFSPAEAGSLGFVHQPGALAAPVDTLVWWNCLFENTTPPPDKWTSEERHFLDRQNILLRTPQQESQLQLLRQQRPILQTARRLILVVPQQADGAEAVPSLLLGDIEAAFPNHKQFHFSLDDENDRTRLSKIFALADRNLLSVRSQVRPRPHLIFPDPGQLADSEYETPTNLESLFYYPHRWFFRQKLRFFPSSLLSVTGDNTLLGSLAHRFFEILLRDEHLATLDRNAVQDWVNTQAATLLEREGATLLLYGREPERNAFLNKVKNAAWSLVSLIRNNGWSVADTELLLEGQFGLVPVRGKADLVLQRDGEFAIVDLKWSGSRRRKELIQNGEDLQLVLYAKLLPPPEVWPHTAYFIIEEGKIIARNNAAFKEAIVAGNSGSDHQAVCEQIFARMERTYAWRLEQIKKGMVEVRTARTASELEALYEGQLFDLLEMKNEDARWDDYRTLVLGG